MNNYSMIGTAFALSLSLSLSLFLSLSTPYINLLFSYLIIPFCLQRQKFPAQCLREFLALSFSSRKCLISAVGKLACALLFCLMFVPASLAADSTSFNPRTVPVKAKSISGVPVGTVVAWPAATNPSDVENWLDCNGQAISQVAYPELYAVTGGTVPNYQGIFLRGHGSQTSSHYNTVTHSSGTLGQMQGDAIRDIYGEFEFKPRRHGSRWPSGAFQNIENTGSSQDSDADRPSGISFRAAYVVPTANENRPVNKAVRYLIRAKP